jgi:small subunit ribosomal protein S2
MARTNFEELLDAGVHFGHLRRKWNPNMAPYIFMERNGIHIIDLYKTMAKLEEASSALKQIAKSGRKVLFVATKKQAKEIVATQVQKVGMPYVVERWPGGMLTNFATIRKAVRKMGSIDKLMATSNFKSLSKRERLQIDRERQKLEKQLGSIADLNRLPSAIFVVDILKEKIAIAEARKLNIPTFAIVDTNSDPNIIDFPIPGNDDASKSIELILRILVAAIEEGLAERKMDKEARGEEDDRDEFDRPLLMVDVLDDEEDAEAIRKKAMEKLAKVKKEEEDRMAENNKRPRRGLSTKTRK